MKAAWLVLTAVLLANCARVPQTAEEKAAYAADKAFCERNLDVPTIMQDGQELADAEAVVAAYTNCMRSKYWK
jgi:hypothetical protein